MSKKHFIELADCLKERLAEAHEYYARSPLYQTVAEREVWHCINAIAVVCKRSNPNFNYDRWISYIKGECGPSGGKKK